MRTFSLVIAVMFLAITSCNKQNEVENNYRLKEVATSSEQWTGLSMSENGRLFVNYPRWSPEIEHSVAEIKKKQPVPFPNKKWNTWDTTMNPKNHFICVQSVFIDDNNNLWVLDPANPMFKGVVNGGAKLLQFNIDSKKLIQRFVFNKETVKSNSYLNDVRIDEDRGFAYITDSNDGAIVVVNTNTGESRRLLDDHFSTRPELPLVINGKPWTNAGGDMQFIASDGIALDNEDEYLYYHALNGLSLYRIHTKYLRDNQYSNKEIAQNVEFVARTGATDGMIAGPDNTIYHTNVEKSAIIGYRPDNKIKTIVKDSRIKWPDTFTFGPDNALYFTTSQIHISNPQSPYKIFKIELK
jgi:sugar lactone lactonase YvrE